MQGVGDASVTDLPIVLGASLVENTNRGPIIGLFPQYAYYGKGRTIHSAVQMEAFGLDVDEKPRKARHPGSRTTKDCHTRWLCDTTKYS